jgi:putative ABC transport system permease protein
MAGPVLKICERIVEVVGSLVPAGRRAAWTQEWRAELVHHWAGLTRHGLVRWRSKLDLLARTAGSLPDALEMRRQEGGADMLDHELKYALRGLLKHRGFTLVAALTLALGIGANSAIFSIVEAVLLRPLPFPEPERLVTIWHHYRTLDRASVSPPNFLDYRSQNSTLDGMAAVATGNFNLAGEPEPERVVGAKVTAGFFPVLGVAPVLGRGLLAEDNEPGHDGVVVLSHGVWTRRFGSDPGLIGRTVDVEGKPMTVVGVLPAGFRFGEAEMWMPLVFRPEQLTDDERGSEFLDVVARLKPGVLVSTAQQDLDLIGRRIAEKGSPKLRRYIEDSGWGITVLPLHEWLVGGVRPALLVLLGAVGLVLLIACANVGSLLLARSTARRRELAIRSALGASRVQLIRQLLTESLLLALLGGIGGLLLAQWITAALASLGLKGIPRLEEIRIDPSVVLFTSGATVFTGLLFGLFPALQSTRLGLEATLREGTAGNAGARSSRRLRSVLVVTEVALALVLLAGSALMLESVARLLAVDPGFRTEGRLTLQVAALRSKYSKDGLAAEFDVRLLERLSAVPGVISAGAVNLLPLTPTDWTQTFDVEDHQLGPGEAPPGCHVRIVLGDYFRTMGIPLLHGRAFTEQDGADSPDVALIDAAGAQRLWPDRDPLGRRIRLGDEKGPWSTIVGVVGDVKHGGLTSPSDLHVYRPLRQHPTRSLSFVLKGSGDVATLIPAVREAVRQIEPDQPIYNVQTMDQIVSDAVARPRFSMLLLACFATAALLLAALGIYGVLADSVAQRTREIGLRMALGARRRDVVRLVVGQGMSLTAAGIGAGTIAALGLTQALRSLLFGVSPTDPPTLAGVAAILVAVALVACVVPARRATRIDPLEAIRYE